MAATTPQMHERQAMPDSYTELKERAAAICRDHRLLDAPIVIRARALSTEEAIGNPERDDFPLQKGKERLMQAEFKGALGQAFTDRWGDFSGCLEEVFTMPLKNNYRRAVFVAALNAVLRHLGAIEGTVHCRDGQPMECGGNLARAITERFGRVRITQIGFQPGFAAALAKQFPFRLLDLDPDNIGREKAGVLVEGPEATADAAKWADLLLVTGTTVANGTVDAFLGNTPVLFYGTTAAGPAHLMGWDRFCSLST